MSDQFRFLMNAVDDDLLEEAAAPVKRARILPWIAAAACLVLVAGLTMGPNHSPAMTLSQLADCGYDIRLPEEAMQISCGITTLTDREAAQASFLLEDTEYVYYTVKTLEPQPLPQNADAQVLSWNSGDLGIQLLSSDTGTSVSWYQQEQQTQCYLTASADTRQVLTTASQILRATGLDVTGVPEGAENITYNAFLLDGLTVAETTFRMDGITCAYRMSATLELLEDFKDISGLTEPFEEVASGEILWCRAKLSFNEGGRGKITWFDVVPGILYSLSMDSGASEEALLELANQLFVPAQENN